MRCSVFKCVALVVVAAWVFCASVECGKGVRRHDVHRIVLKTKNRNRPKKQTRPHTDFHRDHFRFEDDFDPHFDQFGDHSTHHDVYAPQPPRHYNRKRNPHKDFEHHQRPTYDDYKSYDDYKPYDYHNYQGDYEGSAAYRGSYKDFERYKAMMDRYNKRLEDNFKAQSSKYKYNQLPPVESEHPMSWKPPKPYANKGGEWSPMSSMDTPSKSQYNDVTDDPVPNKNIEDLIEITTSKPQKRPSIIVEGHLKKGPSNHKTVNYNFNTNSFHNHRPGNKTTKAKGVNNGSYEVHEELGESIVSPIVANFQNVMPSSETTSYKGSWQQPVVGEAVDVQNDNVFGARTKSRRTKRPATSST